MTDHAYQPRLQHGDVCDACEQPEDAHCPTLLQAVRTLLAELDDLIGESEGVCGLHLNGDDAPWDEILDGGRFERVRLEPLRAAVKL